MRNRDHQREVDEARRPGVTAGEAARITQPLKEERGVRRTNGIPHSAAAALAAKRDRP